MKVTFLLLLMIGGCSLLPVNGTELSGVVKSESGKPLPDVRILTYAPTEKKAELLGFPLTSQRYETATDQNGFFKLPSHGRIVYFKRSDLRPITKLMDLSAARIVVVMEDGARTLWKVPPCSSLADKAQRVGVAFKVVVPKDVFFRKATQFENGGYIFGYSVNGPFESMVIWSDPTSLELREEYLLESQDFFERAWVSGKTVGYESRGVKSDGKQWRRGSFRWGAIAYQGNSEESARVFDRLIDGMCFDKSDLPPTWQ